VTAILVATSPPMENNPTHAAAIDIHRSVR
jgi:hypothetical protein